jgi:hypothetical protein
MKRLFSVLLMFWFLAVTGPPYTCSAQGAKSHETVAKATDNAIVVVIATYDNAAFAEIIPNTGLCQAAATHEVASLTKTPTTEVKAIAVVAGRSYQRLCDKGIFPLKLSNGFGKARLHCDPGLRRV